MMIIAPLWPVACENRSNVPILINLGLGNTTAGNWGSTFIANHRVVVFKTIYTQWHRPVGEIFVEALEKKAGHRR